MVTSKAFVYDPVLILYTVKSCVLGRDHNVNSTSTLHTRFKMEADDTNVVKSAGVRIGQSFYTHVPGCVFQLCDQ